MGIIEEAENEEVGAREWVEANRELVNSWLPN